MLKKQTLDVRYDKGFREYQLPTGDWVPSVTTILGQTKPESAKAGLENWRKRVGDEEADRITKRAGSNGEKLHTACENYLKYEDVEFEDDPFTKSLFMNIRPVLDRITPFTQEVQLWSTRLKTAGRVDVIGLFDVDMSIIDFKNSRKMKKREWIDDYFIQATTYSLMYYEMTGCFVKNIVIPMTSLEENYTKIFKGQVLDYKDEAIKRITSWKEPP